MEYLISTTGQVVNRRYRSIVLRSARYPGTIRTQTLAAAMLLFVVLLAQVSVRVAIISTGYRIEELRQEHLEADQQLRQFKLHYAWLTSPERLTQKAKLSLHMTSIRPQQLRRM